VPIVTNNSQVSFWGGVSGGSATQGIFLSTAGVVSKVAVTGGGTPVGGTYAFFAQIPSPNNSGEVAFWAAINGIAAPACPSFGLPCAVFKVSGATVSKVVASGDTGPAGVGGTIRRPNTVPIMNDSGQVTFWADIANGLSSQALVRVTNGVMENVAAVGNDAPMTPTSGAFSDFIDAQLLPTVPVPNNLGQVSFWAEVSGGSGTEGIFVTEATGGIETEVAALAGKPAPGCGPDCTFGANFDLDINGSGQAVFANTLVDGSGTSGIFLFFAGEPEEALAVQGNSTPAGMTGTYSSFGPPVSNDGGKIVSRATITGGSAGEGIFLFFAGQPVETAQKLAAQNDPAPGTSLFFAGFADPAINSVGHVVARATLKTGGGAPAGEALYLFFAGEPGAPSPNPPELICRTSDASCPAGPSLFFAGFADPAINEIDQVVAKVTLTGDGDEALYLFFAGSPGTDPMLIAREDNPAPTPTPSLFFAGFGEHPDINLDISLNGNVAFRATLKTGGGAPAGEALFLFFAGSVETKLLAKEGAGVPTAVGGNYGPFGDPAINVHNQVVARAGITTGGAGEALFLFFAGSPLDPVEVTQIALKGDPLPANATADTCASGGGTFGGGPPVFPYIAFNNSVQVVYVANVDCPAADPDTQGVFIASLDNDVGGGDFVPDFLDNCPLIANPDQNNTDKALARVNRDVVADELGNACDTDLDGDSLLNVGQDPCPASPDCDRDLFIDGREVYLTTDPLLGCAATGWGTGQGTGGANDEGPPDRWPVDFNDDQRAAMQDVIFAFVTSLAPGGLNQAAVGPLARVDLNGNGFINMQDVILGYVTKLAPVGLNKTCTP
jgi:hypothetical protein